MHVQQGLNLVSIRVLEIHQAFQEPVLCHVHMMGVYIILLEQSITTGKHVTYKGKQMVYNNTCVCNNY